MVQYAYSIWRDDDGCYNTKLVDADYREDCLAWMRKHWDKHGPMALMDNNTGRLLSFVL